MKAVELNLIFFESNRIEQSSISDQKIISAIKRSIFITQLAILTIGALIGTALTNSMGMFYNFIIMLIGGVALLVFKRKWYYAPIAVFSFPICGKPLRGYNPRWIYLDNSIQ